MTDSTSPSQATLASGAGDVTALPPGTGGGGSSQGDQSSTGTSGSSTQDNIVSSYTSEPGQSTQSSYDQIISGGTTNASLPESEQIPGLSGGSYVITSNMTGIPAPAAQQAVATGSHTYAA